MSLCYHCGLSAAGSRPSDNVGARLSSCICPIIADMDHIDKLVHNYSHNLSFKYVDRFQVCFAHLWTFVRYGKESNYDLEVSDLCSASFSVYEHTGCVIVLLVKQFPTPSIVHNNRVSEQAYDRIVRPCPFYWRNEQLENRRKFL